MGRLSENTSIYLTPWVQRNQKKFSHFRNLMALIVLEFNSWYSTVKWQFNSVKVSFNNSILTA